MFDEINEYVTRGSVDVAVDMLFVKQKLNNSLYLLERGTSQ
jgi:hypothetical protein